MFLMFFVCDAVAMYPTMRLFETEMCTFPLQNGALYDTCHCGICEMGLYQRPVDIQHASITFSVTIRTRRPWTAFIDTNYVNLHL